VGTVVVETSHASAGALLVATARGGSGVDSSAASPFAFEAVTDARFVVCLCDGFDDSQDGLVARHDAARETVRACARPAPSIAESIAGSLEPRCGAALVVLASGSVHVGWAGGVETLVLRDRAVLHRTVNRAMTTATSPPRAPGIDLAGPWAVETGDLVLLCSANVHRVLSEGDFTALASRDDLATIVRGIVTTASTRGDFYSLCAVALRIGEGPPTR
jgi:hypothetical protein